MNCKLHGSIKLRPMTYIVGALLVLSTCAMAQVGGPYLPGRTFWGQNHYIEYVVGTSPIMISSAHGGALKPASIADRTYGVLLPDRRTQELARELADAIAQQTGRRPHLILSHLHRSKLDPNREIVEAAQGDSIAEQAWHDFHDFMADAKAQVLSQHGQGLYLDIHGHGHPETWVEFGYTLTAATLMLPDATINAPTHINDSTIRHLGSLPNTYFPEVLRGATSLGGMFETGGIPSVPSPANPDPAGGNYFIGGYNLREYGSRFGGNLDGIQIEFPSSLRLLRADRDQVTSILTPSTDAFLNLHYNIPTLSSAIVTVSATDAWASECGSRGRFTFHRTNGTSVAQIVPFTITGSATEGADYLSLPRSVTIPVGANETTLDVVPLDDVLVEGPESIRLILDDFGMAGDSLAAEVILQDDEPDPSKLLFLALDEASGAAAADDSGNNNHGSLQPDELTGPQRIPGTKGMALSFDGVNDRLVVQDFPWSPTGDATLSFFFRSTVNANSGLQYVFSQGGNSGSPHSLNVYFINATDTLRCALSYGNDLSDINTLDVQMPLRDGSWHHVALTSNALSHARVYIDGELKALTHLGGDVLDPNTDIFFGGRHDLNSTRFFAGDLDELQIHARELSNTEIRSLATGLPPEAAPYPGSNDDLEILTGIDGPTSNLAIKSAQGGQNYNVKVNSPSGTFVGGWAGLGLQPMLTGLPPYQPWSPNVYLFSGLAIEAIPLTILGANGLSLSGIVPPGLLGYSALFQGYVFSVNALNGSYAVTDGHEIRLF